MELNKKSETFMNTKEFYGYLLSKIDSDLFEKGIKTYMLRDLKKSKAYFISQSQYYNIVKLSEGKDAPKFSISKLEFICKKLSIDIEVVYKLNKKT